MTMTLTTRTSTWSLLLWQTHSWKSFSNVFSTQKIGLDTYSICTVLMEAQTSCPCVWLRDYKAQLFRFYIFSLDLVMKQGVVMTEVLSHQWEYFHGQLIVALAASSRDATFLGVCKGKSWCRKLGQPWWGTQGEIMLARLWPRTCPLTTSLLPSSTFLILVKRNHFVFKFLLYSNTLWIPDKWYQKSVRQSF